MVSVTGMVHPRLFCISQAWIMLQEAEEVGIRTTEANRILNLKISMSTWPLLTV